MIDMPRQARKPQGLIALYYAVTGMIGVSHTNLQAPGSHHFRLSSQEMK